MVICGRTDVCMYNWQVSIALPGFGFSHRQWCQTGGGGGVNPQKVSLKILTDCLFEDLGDMKLYPPRKIGVGADPNPISSLG